MFEHLNDRLMDVVAAASEWREAGEGHAETLAYEDLLHAVLTSPTATGRGKTLPAPSTRSEACEGMSQRSR